MSTPVFSRRLAGWCLALSAAGWALWPSPFGRAQDDDADGTRTPRTEAPRTLEGSPEDSEAPRGEPSEPSAPRPTGLPAVRSRASVPELETLERALTTLRRRAHAAGGAGGVGGDSSAASGLPALEHAALALAAARTAERSASDPGSSPAAVQEAREASARARRIAYAALTLAEAQRARDEARVARDQAARERARAEGGLRTANQALSIARRNAGVSGPAPATGPAPDAGSDARGSAAGVSSEGAASRAHADPGGDSDEDAP